MQNRPLDTVVPSLALLAVALVRMMPAFQKIWANVSAITWGRRSLGVVYRDLVELEAQEAAFQRQLQSGTPLRFEEAVRVEDLTFQYEGQAGPALDDMRLAMGALPPFDREAFRAGHLSPVFFGSALRSFGVAELLDALALPPAVFVGHSVAAMIGVLAAADRPDLFDRLVLVAPSPRYVDDEGYRGGFQREEVEELLDTMDENYLGWAEYIAPVIMGVPDRPALGEELANSFCRADPTIARQFARVTFLSDSRDDLARVTTPTLVLQSRHDVIAPIEVGEFVRDAIAGSTYVVLDATGHCPQMSHPEPTVRAIQDFLSRGHGAA